MTPDPSREIEQVIQEMRAEIDNGTLNDNATPCAQYVPSVDTDGSVYLCGDCRWPETEHKIRQWADRLALLTAASPVSPDISQAAATPYCAACATYESGGRIFPNAAHACKKSDATAPQEPVTQGPANNQFIDTPLLAAKRRAFDAPTQANLDALIAAAQAAPQEPWQPIEAAKALIREQLSVMRLVDEEIVRGQACRSEGEFTGWMNASQKTRAILAAYMRELESWPLPLPPETASSPVSGEKKSAEVVSQPPQEKSKG